MSRKRSYSRGRRAHSNGLHDRDRVGVRSVLSIRFAGPVVNARDPTTISARFGSQRRRISSYLPALRTVFQRRPDGTRAVTEIRSKRASHHGDRAVVARLYLTDFRDPSQKPGAGRCPSGNRSSPCATLSNSASPWFAFRLRLFYNDGHSSSNVSVNRHWRTDGHARFNREKTWSTGSQSYGYEYITCNFNTIFDRRLNEYTPGCFDISRQMSSNNNTK